MLTLKVHDGQEVHIILTVNPRHLILRWSTSHFEGIYHSSELLNSRVWASPVYLKGGWSETLKENIQNFQFSVTCSVHSGTTYPHIVTLAWTFSLVDFKDPDGWLTVALIKESAGQMIELLRLRSTEPFDLVAVTVSSVFPARAHLDWSAVKGTRSWHGRYTVTPSPQSSHARAP